VLVPPFVVILLGKLRHASASICGNSPISNPMELHLPLLEKGYKGFYIIHMHFALKNLLHMEMDSYNQNKKTSWVFLLGTIFMNIMCTPAVRTRVNKPGSLPQAQPTMRIYNIIHHNISLFVGSHSSFTISHFFSSPCPKTFMLIKLVEITWGISGDPWMLCNKKNISHQYSMNWAQPNHNLY
jgi:hypothetical protein